jgi:hypothetical protein
VAIAADFGHALALETHASVRRRAGRDLQVHVLADALDSNCPAQDGLSNRNARLNEKTLRFIAIRLQCNSINLHPCEHPSPAF